MPDFDAFSLLDIKKRNKRSHGKRKNGNFNKTLTSGLGLDDMSLAWPAVVQLLVFIYSGIQ